MWRPSPSHQCRTSDRFSVCFSWNIQVTLYFYYTIQQSTCLTVQQSLIQGKKIVWSRGFVPCRLYNYQNFLIASDINSCVTKTENRCSNSRDFKLDINNFNLFCFTSGVVKYWKKEDKKMNEKSHASVVYLLRLTQ